MSKVNEDLERELRQEFIEKMKQLQKTAKFKRYKSMDELWDEIENDWIMAM